MHAALRALAAAAALFVFAAVGRPAPAAEPEWVWPPKGPQWMTDPEAALEKARAEKKPVLVYVATEACPHCKVMAKETWPEKSVVEGTKDVVCLAVYRWRRADDEAVTGAPRAEGRARGGTEDSDWAIRLDVKGYPQLRILDGWGRTLAGSDRHANARTPAQVLAAVRDALDQAKDARKPAAPDLPEKLAARLGKSERAAAGDPVGSIRCRTWMRALAKGEWSAQDVVALWRADDDGLLRMRLLQRMGGDTVPDCQIEVAEDAVKGASDYHRGEALRLLGKAGGGRAAKVLAGVILQCTGGGSRFHNPNNVLCEATEATLAKPDRAYVEALGSVLATQQANNYATLLATKSLVAIGKLGGKGDLDLVRPHLEKARKLEGPHAKQIRAEVESLLGR